MIYYTNIIRIIRLYPQLSEQISGYIRKKYGYYPDNPDISATIRFIRIYPDNFGYGYPYPTLKKCRVSVSGTCTIRATLF